MVGILSISLSSSMMLLMRLESFGMSISVHVRRMGFHWLDGIFVCGFRALSCGTGVFWVDAGCMSCISVSLFVGVAPQEIVVLFLAFLELPLVIVVNSLDVLVGLVESVFMYGAKAAE